MNTIGKRFVNLKYKHYNGWTIFLEKNGPKHLIEGSGRAI